MRVILGLQGDSMIKGGNKVAKLVAKNGTLRFMSCAASIGAAVYFVQQSSGLRGRVLALLKALVWPAYVVYEVLKRLKV